MKTVTANNCFGCFACYSKCPKEAIKMVAIDGFYLYIPANEGCLTRPNGRFREHVCESVALGRPAHPIEHVID